MYEYKSVVLESTYDERLEESHCQILNGYFDVGWEYVDNISQTIAQGSNGSEYGSVLVILRKKKEDITL